MNFFFCLYQYLYIPLKKILTTVESLCNLQPSKTNKTTESAEETGEKVRRIIRTNLDMSREDFDYELDKVQTPP